MSSNVQAQADDHRLYALLPGGAERIPFQGTGAEFYRVYQGLCHGVYEAARTYPGGKLYGFGRHMQRFEAGCAALQFQPGLNEAQLRQGLQQVIDGFPDGLAKLRWDACKQPYGCLGTQAHMIATITPLPVVPAWVYSDGVSLRTTSDLQRKDPHTKGSHFAVERNRIPFGTKENYEHLLVSEDGYLLEGAMSNFGAFVGDTLYAPTRDALAGITITTLADLARENGLKVSREHLHRDRLSEIDEAFLCSSVRGFVPVTQVDGKPIGNGRVGERYQRVHDLYHHFAQEHARRLVPIP